MKSEAVNRWVELKKNTRNFEIVLEYRRILKKGTQWDNMSQFFREADKFIK